MQNWLQDHLPGLTITINKQPRTNLGQLQAGGQYELSISGWITDSSDLDSYFNSHKRGSPYSYGGYVNEDYTALTRNACTVDTNDPDKIFEDYKSAESILLIEDVAQVPLHQSVSNYLIRSTIKGTQSPAYGVYFYSRTASVEK